MGSSASDLDWISNFTNEQGRQGVDNTTEMSLWLFKAILLARIC